jgi:hypothetical protein
MFPCARPRGFVAALICASAMACASACTHAGAQVASVPALDVPLPPPRVIGEVENPAPLATPLSMPVGTALDEPVRVPTIPGARGARPAASARPDTKPAEPPKVETPTVVDQPKPEPPKAAAPSLQTTPPEREAQLEARVGNLLQQARNSLSKIDYRKLGADAKEQYDTAKRWIQLAEDGLKAKNIVYAESLADKAATLATQLASR